MEVIRNILLQTGITERAAIMLVVLLLFVPAVPFLAARIRAGKRPTLRPIPGFDALRRLSEQAMETGQPVHMSVGVEGVSTSNTAQTLAGLTALHYLSDQAALYGGSPLVSVADPTALVAGQDVVRKAFRARGQVDRFNLNQVRMIAPPPTVYAAGVMGILSRESVLANVMLGSFGEEYLLMGETGARKGLRQVVGSGNVQTLPFMYLSTEEAVIGEELFAAGAYLSSIPTHVASLLAQDWMRIVFVLAIIVGVIIATVG
jgi:hypothetical protein